MKTVYAFVLTLFMTGIAQAQAPATATDRIRLADQKYEALFAAEHTDGDEYNLVGRLRQSRFFIPELSLVAQTGDKIVGHILFTKLKAGQTTQLALAPLAVLPDYQRQGIGGRLINEGHKIARHLGYAYSVVIGYPAYYPRFGYVDAAKFGLRASFELPKGVFMACDLQGNGLPVNAEVEYPAEFFAR